MEGIRDSKGGDGVAATCSLSPRLSGAPRWPEQSFGENMGFRLCNCVREREQRENQAAGVEEKNETISRVTLVSLDSYAFSNVSRRPLEGEREEGCCSFKNYATLTV